MSHVFRVAVQYDNDNGYIEYDEEAKTVAVHLADQGKCREAIAYLSSVQTLRTQGQTLLDFQEWQAEPTESLKSFQTALGNLWVKTGVHVDWSRPT